MAQEKPHYINGVFTTKYEGVGSNGEPYEFFKQRVKLDEHIKELQALKNHKDENGFITLRMNAHKSNPSKYSTMLDTWKPTNAENKNGITAQPAVVGSSDPSDDLPF